MTPTLSDLLTNASIAEPWPGSRRRWSNRVNGMQWSDSYSRRATRTRSRLGSRTLSGFFTSSTYVRSILSAVPRLSTSLPDRARDRYQHGGCGYPHDGCGHSPKRADGKGRCLRPKPPGMYDWLSFSHKMLTSPRLKLGQQYMIQRDPQSHVPIACF